MNRRDAIRMTDDEVTEFLAGHGTAQVATVLPDGMPHLIAMWYGLIDGEIVMWTYAKSQKAVNLGRDPKIACMVEAGENYDELRGVTVSGFADLSTERRYVEQVGEAVLSASPLGRGGAPVDYEGLRRSAAKRVAITVKATRVLSWDHRKLAAAPG